MPKPGNNSNVHHLVYKQTMVHTYTAIKRNRLTNIFNSIMILKCCTLLNEINQTQKFCIFKNLLKKFFLKSSSYFLYGFIYMPCWKGKKHQDRKKMNGCQWLGLGEGTTVTNCRSSFMTVSMFPKLIEVDIWKVDIWNFTVCKLILDKPEEKFLNDSNRTPVW